MNRLWRQSAESVTDVFVYLASDDANGMIDKLLSVSAWKCQVKRTPAPS